MGHQVTTLKNNTINQKAEINVMRRSDINWTALSSSNHANLAISRNRNYSFAREQIVIELFNFELQQAVASIPVAFIKDNNTIKLCGILGLERGKSLFVNDSGGWQIPFVPAAISSFPFRLGKVSDGRQAVLFAADDENLVGPEEGNLLFNEGKPSKVLNEHLKLLANMHSSSQRLAKSMDILEEMGLFQPFEINIPSENNQYQKVGGLLGINLQAFNNLEDQEFIRLREMNVIELIYAHFYSLSCIQRLLVTMGFRRKMEGGLKDLGSKIFDSDEKDIDFKF